jgi:predicted component of type VI protein secretion system
LGYNGNEMIEFKIIAAPDKSQQATYQHLGKELSFGQTEGDMILDDPALAPLQLRIFWENGAFFLENVGGGVEVRLNGRPIEGRVPIKEKDNLNMGRVTLSFSRLDLDPPSPPPPFEHPQFSTRVTEGSKEKAILDALTTLEQKEGTAPPGAPPLPGAPMPPLPGAKPPLPPGAPPPPPRKP